MNHFSFPESFQDQKEWTKIAEIRMIDAEYTRMRRLAVRRVILGGILRAFETFPEIDRVVFSFKYNKKSLKDSILAFGANGDEKEDKKINERFSRFMGPIRSSVGQDVSTWEGVGSFFQMGETTLTRDEHEFFIERMFDENVQGWNNETQAQWRAEMLDTQTPATHAKRTGPRL